MAIHKYKYRYFTILPTLAILLVRVSSTLAQDLPGDGEFKPVTQSRELIDLIIGMVDWIMFITLPFLAIAITWAGFRIVSARGSEAELTAAKGMLLWSVIGSVIVIAAPTLARIIRDVFTF
jgi:hypothetical protein